jgi:hypothetical protein
LAEAVPEARREVRQYVVLAELAEWITLLVDRARVAIVAVRVALTAAEDRLAPAEAALTGFAVKAIQAVVESRMRTSERNTIFQHLAEIDGARVLIIASVIAAYTRIIERDARTTMADCIDSCRRSALLETLDDELLALANVGVAVVPCARIAGTGGAREPSTEAALGNAGTVLTGPVLSRLAWGLDPGRVARHAIQRVGAVRPACDGAPLRRAAIDSPHTDLEALVLWCGKDAEIVHARADEPAVNRCVTDSERVDACAFARLARYALPVGAYPRVALFIADFAVITVAELALSRAGVPYILLTEIGRLGTGVAALLPHEWEHEHQNQRGPRSTKRTQIGHRSLLFCDRAS